jgi:hypothetical protein
MGVYITIVGEYPCPKCGRILDDWQCKELEYDGYPVDILMQRYKLNKKMNGEMYNTCETCGPVRCEITRGRIAKAIPVTTQVRKQPA